MEKCSSFSFIFFSIICGSAKKPDDNKNSKEDGQMSAGLC